MAHHSIAGQYDLNRPVTLKGTVTKLEWMNPHIYFYIDVKDGAGKVTNWTVEGGSPNGLLRYGWTKNSLKLGDDVTVEGILAKDNSNLALMSVVTIAGKKVLGRIEVPGEPK
jgi:DNA/RNA endonuclease YhcR with UshA esterase domain